MLWALLAACAPSGDADTAGVLRETVFETEATRWAEGDPADDPQAEHRPDGATCPAATWGVEGQALEIETGACAFAWFVQPVDVAIDPGAHVVAELWHGVLDAAEPATAHAALSVDGGVVWEATVDIPGEPDIAPIDAVAPDGAAAGALLGLHLHNHGDNAWSLGPVSVEQVP